MPALGTGRAAGTPDLALRLAHCVIASSLLNSLNPVPSSLRQL